MPIEYYLNGYIVYVCILQDTFRLGQYPTGYYLNGYFAPWSISYRILPQRIHCALVNILQDTTSTDTLRLGQYPTGYYLNGKKTIKG